MMRVSELGDWVPVSALQHYVYCPRQCSLIHLDGAWEDNLFTLRGRRVHEQVDVPDGMVRQGLRVERALPIWSEGLRIVGRADVVEFLQDGTPYPVEHKVGPRKYRLADEVQLCAQALCLEEMFGVPVLEGALYYHKSKRRRRVVFNKELRSKVLLAIKGTRTLLQQEALPPPVADARCRDCSLQDICLPFADGWLEEEGRRD